MKNSTRLVLLICLVCFLNVTAIAQRAASQTAEQSPGTTSADPIANELSLLRKSLQTLNSRLQVISDGLLAPEAKSETESKERLKRISTNFDLLTRSEERAEILRKQLIELTEKETQFKMRLTQLEEEMRPENIERTLSTYGTTRTVEIRETRRRVLENEKRGVENLLQITSQSRLRLEEDVRQADQLVSKLRQRLFPLIDKEIEKISPE
jgi:hypothetical protein